LGVICPQARARAVLLAAGCVVSSRWRVWWHALEARRTTPKHQSAETTALLRLAGPVLVEGHNASQVADKRDLSVTALALRNAQRPIQQTVAASPELTA
jgi:hypothetical protein